MPADAVTVPVRDYIETQIDLRISCLRELMDEREKAQATALQLHTTEMQRRLGDLNHAHEQMLAHWRTSLPRELFEQFKVDYDDWREHVNGELTRITTRAMTWSAAVALILVLLGLALKIGGTPDTP